MTREFDSPWKDALDLYLQPFLALFFPDIHEAIDWSKGYESLDKELSEIIREAELGPTVADKLFRVYLADGQDAWLLIHIEVQTQPDASFGERMFKYGYRIIDRYNRDVVSLAILGDMNRDWRPVHYERMRFGTGPSMRFRPIKLIDWVDRMEELDRNPSPIAAVVLAHLQSLLTHGDTKLRFDAKRRLLLGLYDRGYSQDDRWQLRRLVEWFLELPKELDAPLRIEVYEYAKEKQMPYVTGFEQLAREEGFAEGRSEGRLQELHDSIALLVESKFGEAGAELIRDLQTFSDVDKLRELQRSVVRTSKTVEELRAILR